MIFSVFYTSVALLTYERVFYVLPVSILFYGTVPTVL